MKWTDFIQTLEHAEVKMRQITDDLSQYSDFLKKTCLVVTHGAKQFDIKKDISVHIFLEYIDLFQDLPQKKKLWDLISLLQWADSYKKFDNALKKNNSLKIEEKIRQITKEIINFPLAEMEIVDDFDISLIFPSVNIEAIQSAKNHMLANKEKVCLCKACIRGVLY